MKKFYLLTALAVCAMMVFSCKNDGKGKKEIKDATKDAVEAVEDAAQDGDDHEQVNEQDRRRRQLVTGTLQTRQELVKPALLDSPFLLVVLSHEIFLLKKLVRE